MHRASGKEAEAEAESRRINLVWLEMCPLRTSQDRLDLEENLLMAFSSKLDLLKSTQIF